MLTRLSIENLKQTPRFKAFRLELKNQRGISMQCFIDSIARLARDSDVMDGDPILITGFMPRT